MTSPRSKDIKQSVTDLFDIVADDYDNPSTRFFTFCADKMLDILQPKQNTQLLDIATGTGAVAISAAKMVLPKGHVHGIDLSESMLNKAFSNSQKKSLNNIDLQIMDAEEPIFQNDYFHNITCSFGIFFIPDMANALSNWLRILQPGGTIIFSTFASEAFSPLTDIFRERLKQYDILIPDESWYRLSKEAECRELLDTSGFTNIKTQSMQLGYHLPNIEDWWDILWNTGYRGLLNQLSASDLTKFRDEHLNEVQQFNTEDGLWLNIQTIYSTADKAL